MATAILKEIFEIELVRTRDENVLKELDIVYDVGGGEFDHHGIEKVYREDGIPYAACGLIWKRFGKDVILSKGSDLSEDEVEGVHRYIDRGLIEGVDALDNGVEVGRLDIPVMNITALISGFNPPWHSVKNENEAFNEAVEIVSPVLRNTIGHRLAVLKSREKVVKAYENRKTAQVLILDEYCPYGEALKDIDENMEVLYVVYPEKDKYTLQTVRGSDGQDRRKLPESWAGKRNEELAAVTGVKDAVFCHTGRFIAVAASYEGIIKLAEIAIRGPKKEERGFLSFITRLLGR